MGNQQREQKHASCGGRRRGLLLALLGMLVSITLLLGNLSTGWAQTDDQPGSIWGKLEQFTNTYIIVDGKRFTYTDDPKTPLIIHSRSLTPDKRGNVKITLDRRGQVLEISFYGIDEPEAFEKYFTR